MNTPLTYNRHRTHGVHVHTLTIGGDSPVVIQSMTNTPTLDVKASARQVLSLARAGASLVRLTAQGVNHARALGEIMTLVREHDSDVALSADIHFNPAAAIEAAHHVDKVRINPGNFVDPARTFKSLTYTDAEYDADLKRIDDSLVSLLELCRRRGVVLRLGVNHGSLSDRIMSRYGDTPAGMVESAMEFLRVCRRHDFDDVVISVKSSNVTVMVETLRLMVKKMEAEGMDYPLHLGVTEAGDGDDARVKSAVGIGTLLAEGIGDTIRVSLAEPPENEIPVAQMIIDHIERMARAEQGQTMTSADLSQPRLETLSPITVPGYDDPALMAGLPVIEATGDNALYKLKRAMAAYLTDNDGRAPLVRVVYPADMPAPRVTVAASIDLGALLMSGAQVSAIEIAAPALSRKECTDLALNILQATRRRITHTEYIACPGCGRTMFDLQSTLENVRRATSHLTGLKIGVMGCIVNGPGEMADADYGYVGAAAGKVSLYRAKECIKQNIPSEQAVDELIDLIRADGRWTDPK